jgi:hypothetical protein
MTGRILPMWECIQNQAQPLLNRICPIPACVEWRVAHWNGVGLIDSSLFFFIEFCKIDSF